jgi:uncharacterized protein YjbJ (UPF0337 family)
MGINDSINNMAGKAKDAAGSRGDDAVDAAGDKVDERTNSKYADKVDKGQDAAKDAIRKMKK